MHPKIQAALSAIRNGTGGQEQADLLENTICAVIARMTTISPADADNIVAMLDAFHVVDENPTLQIAFDEAAKAFMQYSKNLKAVAIFPQPMATEPTPTPQTAPEILIAGADAIDNRAQLRDQDDGERSMMLAVDTFNALTGQDLTEQEGWLFMSCLKLARAQGGKHHLDDYIDCAAYIALAGECAERDGK